MGTVSSGLASAFIHTPIVSVQRTAVLRALPMN
jgi:hypothetical protein